VSLERQQIAAVLTRRAGIYLCPECLAREVEISLSRVRRATRTLTGDEFEMRLATCANCLTKGWVVRSTAGVSMDPRAQAVSVLLRNPENPLCDGCVALAAQITLEQARRTIAYLEGLPEFRVKDAVCGVCLRDKRVITAIAEEIWPGSSIDLGQLVTGTVRYRSYQLRVLSYRTLSGWRPLILVQTVEGTLVPEAPLLLGATFPSRAEADQHGVMITREWLDKRDAGRADDAPLRAG